MKKFLLFLFLIILFSFYSYIILSPKFFNLNIDLVESAHYSSLYNGKLAPRFIWLFFFIN